MRLAVLIVIGVVVLGGAVAGYYHFRSWGRHRLDEPIYTAATEHGLDPALVKALMLVQGRYAPSDNETRVGLMRVRDGAVERYRATLLDRPWGYVCPNRHFPNHDPDTPASDKQLNCEAPGCGRLMVREPLDLAINLDIACWWLSEIETVLKARDPDLPISELERRTLIAYRYGLPSGAFTTTAEQDRFLADVSRLQARYRPEFERLAERIESE
jgi:hypothetical protein